MLSLYNMYLDITDETLKKCLEKRFIEFSLGFNFHLYYLNSFKFFSIEVTFNKCIIIITSVSITTELKDTEDYSRVEVFSYKSRLFIQTYTGALLSPVDLHLTKKLSLLHCVPLLGTSDLYPVYLRLPEIR